MSPRFSALVPLVLALTGCASTAQRVASTPVGDPLERVNRAVYRFNEKADRWVLRPAAVGWRKGVPQPLRTGVRNVLDHWSYPIDTVNAFLQGKFRQGGSDLARFTLNTIVGLGGLFDPATEVGLAVHDEDFGQTLNRWGVPQGPYLMVPVFGPYTLSHGVGTLADAPLSPYISFQDPAAGLVLYAVYAVDARGAFLDSDAEVRQAFDPYAFIRDAYLQNRAYKIADGVLPEPDYEDDDYAPPAGEDEGADAPTPADP